MRKRTSKILSLLLATTMLLTACGGDSNSTVASNNVAEETSTVVQGSELQETEEVKEIVNLSLYPADAKLISGEVTGYRAEFFAEHGIALDVWAYSAEKTNAILASGALPDIMYVADKDLPTMIEAGMVLCLDDYLDQIPNIEKYPELQTALEYMKEYKSAGTGKVYGLPLLVGGAVKKAVPDTDRYAVKILWDVYEEIGAPEITSFDDLIDVMEEMHKVHPTDENGNKVFGTILNGGGDTTNWGCMTLWYMWQGYLNTDLKYFLERNMVEGKAYSIFEEDSVYRAGLKWYNEVYRRGLLDEDSINIDRATQAPKINNSLVLIPSGSLPGFAPMYYQYYIPGTTIYYNPTNAYGTTQTLCVNAKTTNLDACLELLNLWCDPYTQFTLSYGPEGDAWYLDGNDAYLTDRFKAYLEKKNWGINGYIYANGEEMSVFNCNFVLNSGATLEFTDGNGNPRQKQITAWNEFAEAQQSVENFVNWQKTTGYDNWMEWLEEEDAFTNESDLADIDPFLSIPDDVMQLTIDAIKDIVVNASWQMVYADSEEEFDAIWDKMVKDSMELGAQDIVDWRLADTENAKAIRDALKNK